MKKTLVMLLAICLIVSFTGCGSEEMDYNNPDVDLFVKQLKAGTYKMKNDKRKKEIFRWIFLGGLLLFVTFPVFTQ